MELAVNTHVRHSTIFSCELEKVLANLCPLWLGMSGSGYLGTRFAVRSPALLVASVFHLSGILILPYIGCWSFLFTGAVMVFSLLVLAEL